MTENERLTNSDKEIPTLDDNAEYWLQVYFKLKDYEAIGTVEELQKLKLLFGNENVEISELITKILKEYPEYLSIGTVEEFKELKEKSVAKKAIGKREYNEAYCPCCNEVISDGEFWALNEYVHHCNECGQAVKGVDWE